MEADDEMVSDVGAASPPHDLCVRCFHRMPESRPEMRAMSVRARCRATDASTTEHVWDLVTRFA